MLRVDTWAGVTLDVIVDIDRYTNNLNVRVDTWVECHWM